MIVKEFLKSQVNYPLTDDQVEAICIKRGLTLDEEVDQFLIMSPMLRLAYADTLVFLATMVNISQGGSVSSGNTAEMLNIANKIYKQNNEPTVSDSASPQVKHYFLD